MNMRPTTIKSKQNLQNKPGVLPPWLWAWLLLYLSITPVRLGFLWQNSIKPALSQVSIPKYDSLPMSLIWALPTFAEAFTLVLLFVGVLCLIFPRLRQRYIEQRYNLKEPSSKIPLEFREIIATIEAYAPETRIRTNLLMSEQLVFAYPTGYRRSGIAVFGGLVNLWKSDKQLGQTVLLHEVAYCCHENTLMVGKGSLLKSILNRWFQLLVILFIIPAILLYVWFLADSLHDHWQLGRMAAELSRISNESANSGVDSIDISSNENWLVTWFRFQKETFFSLGASSAFASIFMLIFSTPTIIASALAAMWCAELNADLFVIAEQRNRQSLLHSLQLISPSKSRWKWLTTRLSRTPFRLRRWFITNGQTNLALLGLLLLFPLSSLVRLLFLSVQGVTVLGLVYGNDISTLLIEGNGSAMLGLGPHFFLLGLIIFAHYKALARWEYSCRRMGRYTHTSSYKQYIWAIGILLFVGTLAYILGTFMAP